MGLPGGAIDFLESVITQTAIGIGATTAVFTEGRRVADLRVGEDLNLSKISLLKSDVSDIASERGQIQLLVLIYPDVQVHDNARTQREEIRSYLTEVADLAATISEGGKAVVLLRGNFRRLKESELFQIFQTSDLSIDAVINPPAIGNFFHQSTLVIASKHDFGKTLFLDSATSLSPSLVQLENPNYGPEEVAEGVWIEPASFRSFEHWKVQKEVEALADSFGHFESRLLGDIARLNQGRELPLFEDYPNCVYLPVIGNGSAETALSRLDMKHKWYIQLVLDEKLVMAEFLCGFLNTRYFRLLLQAEKESRSSVNARLTLNDAASLPISLPTLEVQKEIGDRAAKMSRLRSLVNDLAHQYSINPLSLANDHLINESLQIFGRLTEEDEILSMIREGESLRVEFKETLSMDKDTKAKKTELLFVVLKAVAAFMNTNGGDVLVGVRDDGQIVGVDDEIELLYSNKKKDGRLLDKNDAYFQYLSQNLSNNLSEHLHNIDFGLKSVDGKTILRISCNASDRPVWLTDKGRDIFYRRLKPLSEPIDGRTLVEYLKQRFPD